MTYDIPGQGPWARHFGGGAPPSPPPPPPPPPEPEDPAVKEQVQKAKRAAKLRRGRGSSLLTGEQQFLTPSSEEGRSTLG
jgi:hypothetical protein